MASPANVVAFIEAQRKVLNELETLVEAPEYRRLFVAAGPVLIDEDPVPWISHLPIEPCMALRAYL